MTVCIAAICKSPPGGWAIVTASDRMITFEASAIKYEPDQYKAGHIAPTVTILIAGDFTVHNEAYDRTVRVIAPDFPVEDVAREYAQQIGLIRKERAHQTYLTPLGMTEDDLAAGKPLAVNVAQEILDYKIDAEAIVAGQDSNGAHLYFVDRLGIMYDLTGVGFAAIGSGAEHAKSEFMFARFSRHMAAFGPTFLLAYSAKRRAEVAPGVGEQTDMHIIGNDGITYVRPDAVAKAKETYDQRERDKLAIDRAAELEMDSYISALIAQHQPKPTPPKEPEQPLLLETKDGQTPPPPSQEKP